MVVITVLRGRLMPLVGLQCDNGPRGQFYINPYRMGAGKHYPRIYAVVLNHDKRRDKVQYVFMVICPLSA